MKTIIALILLVGSAHAQGISMLLGASRAPSGGYSGPTIVQSCENFTGSGGVTSIGCTFGSNITAGHRLYFCVSYSASSTTSWSGDSGTFTPDPGSGAAITNLQWNNGDPAYITCAYVASAGGGGATVTATLSPGGWPSIIGYEVLGGTFDKSDNGSAPNPGTPTPPYSSLAVTPAANNSLLLGVCAQGGGTVVLGAGTNVAWTVDAITTNNNFLFEHFGQVTAASITAQCNAMASNYYWWVHIAVFH
jgi:hypothetical protein